MNEHVCVQRNQLSHNDSLASAKAILTKTHLKCFSRSRDTAAHVLTNALLRDKRARTF